MPYYLNKNIGKSFLIALLSISVVSLSLQGMDVPEKEAPKKEVEQTLPKEVIEQQKKDLAAKMASTRKKQEEAQKQREAAKKQLADVDESVRRELADKTPEELRKLLESEKETPKRQAIEATLKVKATQARAEELKKRMAETTEKLKALPQTTSFKEQVLGTLKGKATGFSFKVALASIGAIGLAFSGIGYAVQELMEEFSQASGATSVFASDFKKQWGIGGSESGVIPNPSPAADPDDPEYDKTLTEIAGLFSDFDQDLKKMLEKNADYNSDSINFEVGQVDIDGTQVTVNIKYDLEKSDVGLSFLPVLITIAPQDIRGFALTPAEILRKMNDGDAKKALTLILNPTASFIFTIKLIQLNNLMEKDSTKTTREKIEYMLDEVTELYSRLVLTTTEETTPEAFVSYLQQYPTVSEILSNKKVRVYKTLTDEINTPLESQKTAFMDMQKSEIVEGSVIDAMKVFYNQFYQVYYKKFKNDSDYAAYESEPCIRTTKNSLQAIFYKALKDIMKAGQELAAAESKVTLRKLDGTEYEVDAKLDIQSLISKPTATMETASKTLKDAISGIAKIIDAAKDAKKAVVSKDMSSAKEAYTKAVESVKNASSSANQALLEFRKKNAPFYPIIRDDGTSLTPAEFLVANIKELNSTDATNVKALLSKVYNPFSKHLGLSTAQLLGRSQEKIVEKAVSTVKKVVTKQ